MKPLYHGEPYTEDELDYIREHYGKTPTVELAADLGRTPESVRTIAKRLGVQKHREPRDSWEPLFRELHGRGCDVTDIHERTGASNENVRKRLRKLGLKPHRSSKRVNAARKAKRYEGGLNWAEWLALRRRVKAGRLWPGCRNMTEVKICRALFEAGNAVDAPAVPLSELCERIGWSSRSDSPLYRAVSVLVEAGMVSVELVPSRTRKSLMKVYRLARRGTATNKALDTRKDAM